MKKKFAVMHFDGEFDSRFYGVFNTHGKAANWAENHIGDWGNHWAVVEIMDHKEVENENKDK